METNIFFPNRPDCGKAVPVVNEQSGWRMHEWMPVVELQNSEENHAQLQHHTNTALLPELMSHFLGINQVIHWMLQAADGPNPAADPDSNWYSRRIKFYIH